MQTENKLNKFWVFTTLILVMGFLFTLTSLFIFFQTNLMVISHLGAAQENSLRSTKDVSAAEGCQEACAPTTSLNVSCNETNIEKVDIYDFQEFTFTTLSSEFLNKMHFNF